MEITSSSPLFTLPLQGCRGGVAAPGRRAHANADYVAPPEVPRLSVVEIEDLVRRAANLGLVRRRRIEEFDIEELLEIEDILHQLPPEAQDPGAGAGVPRRPLGPHPHADVVRLKADGD